MELPKHDTDYLINDTKLVQFRDYLSRQKKRDNGSPKKAWNYLFKLCEEVNYEEVEKVEIKKEVQQSSNREENKQQVQVENTIPKAFMYQSQEDTDMSAILMQKSYKNI